MALFMVQHIHSADTCPAPDPQLAPGLLKVIAAAPQAGVKVLAEAVVDGQHELNLIVEADAAAAVETWMAPFAQMGSVSVRPASHCERVVERGAC